MKRRTLHLWPHVALTCMAFFSWFSGCVMTQQRTLTFSASASARAPSPSKVSKFELYHLFPMHRNLIIQITFVMHFLVLFVLCQRVVRSNFVAVVHAPAVINMDNIIFCYFQLDDDVESHNLPWIATVFLETILCILQKMSLMEFLMIFFKVNPLSLFWFNVDRLFLHLFFFSLRFI